MSVVTPPRARATDDDVGTEYPVIDRMSLGPLQDTEHNVEAGTSVDEVRHPTVVPDVFEVAVAKKVIPIYPNELQVLYGEQAIRCSGKVWIDAKGRPLRVSLLECPDGFQMAALNAIQHWRWEAPTEAVPEGGLPVAVRTGFARVNHRYYPGVTYFAHPEEVTANPSRPVLLKSGKMPRYPRQVNAGDDSCLVELTVDWHGNTRSPIVDECADPFRIPLSHVLRTWKWTWTNPPEKGDSVTLVTEVIFKL